jgi:hypothetical protein
VEARDEPDSTLEERLVPVEDAGEVGMMAPGDDDDEDEEEEKEDEGRCCSGSGSTGGKMEARSASGKASH